MSANDGPDEGLRAGVERRSAVLLTFLHALRWPLAVSLAALLIAGMVMTGWPAAIPLLLVAAALGWWAYLSWPILDLQGRIMRIVGLTILLIFAGGHLSGQF